MSGLRADQMFWLRAVANPPPGGVKSVELLEQLGFKRLPAGETFARPGLRFESYPNMGHSSSPKEIEDLREWIIAALK